MTLEMLHSGMTEIQNTILTYLPFASVVHHNDDLSSMV